MNIGLTLHMDADHISDVVARYQEQLSLVKQAEAVGLQCIWLTEHHGQPDSPIPRPELFIAFAAAQTERIQFGTGALLLGQRSAWEIAEIIATLAVLAPGRIKIGLAKGGPFIAHQQIWAESEQRGARFLAALPQLHDWLQGRAAPLQADTAPIELVPYCAALTNLPIYLASRAPEVIKAAAHYGYGLMVAQFWPISSIIAVMAQYTALAGQAPRLMVSRGIYIHDDPDIARQRALAHIEQVRRRKKHAKRGTLDLSPETTQLTPHNMPEPITADNIDQFALIGCPKTIQRHIEFYRALGICDLSLSPLTDNTGERHDQITRIGALLAACPKSPYAA